MLRLTILKTKIVKKKQKLYVHIISNYHGFFSYLRMIAKKFENLPTAKRTNSCTRYLMKMMKL